MRTRQCAKIKSAILEDTLKSNKSVFDLINAVVAAGIDIVSPGAETKAARKMQIRRRVRLPRLDGDGDQMTSVLSPTGEDNVPVANVVARYAAMGVELIDRDILEDRLNGLSLEQAASKYGMTRQQIRMRESRLMQAMNKLGEKIPYGKSKESLGPKIGERLGRESRQSTIPRAVRKPAISAAEREKSNRKRELNIRRLAKGGLSPDEIATLMKLDRPYVDAVLSSNPGRRATSIETRRAVIAAWDADNTLSMRDLGQMFGLTAPALTRILGSHKPWRDLIDKTGKSSRKPNTRKKRTTADLPVGKLSLRRTPSGRLSYSKPEPKRMPHAERRARLTAIAQWMADNPDQSNDEVAKKFGLSETYISSIRSKYKDTIPELKPRRTRSKQRVEEIVQSLVDNPNQRASDVAKQFGVTEAYVYTIRGKYKIPKSTLPGKKRGKAPSPETRERHLEIVKRLINNPTESETDIAEAFGISRERVRQIKNRYSDEFPELAKRPKAYGRASEKNRARYAARRTWTDDDEQKLRDFIKKNPKATIAQTRRQFPTISKNRIDEIMRADTVRKATARQGGNATLQDVATLYDELAYEGMSVADRTAMAQAIADELDMPVQKVSLLISKITNARNKKTRTGRISKAVAEYRQWLAEYDSKKVPIGAKKKKLDELAKKYDTTPGTLLTAVSQSSLSDAAVKAIEQYEKYMESDDFFTVSRFSMYQQIAKSTGLSESTVGAIISRWGKVQFSAEDAKKDLKRAKITPTDRQMLADLINGKTIDEIAKDFGVSPSTASSRINLLKDLTRKHNLRIYGRTENRETDSKPNPKPLPPVRRRYWAEGDDLKKPDAPRKKTGKKKLT